MVEYWVLFEGICRFDRRKDISFTTCCGQGKPLHDLQFLPSLECERLKLHYVLAMAQSIG